MGRVTAFEKTTSRIVDGQTGEVTHEITEVEVTERAPMEPAYIKVYLGMIETLYELRGQEANVALELAKRMTYASAGQVVYVNPAMKREIAATLSMKPTSVSNAITRLTKAGVIKRVDTGKYEINPYVFARGDWTSVRRLQGTFSLSPDKISVTVSPEFDETERQQAFENS